MVKRVKSTKVGDVFEVPISPTEKRYMQYVVSDLTQLNSDVVRGFSKTYSVDDKPSLEDIVSDEVDFYAHCDSRFGIKMEYWTLYGNIQDMGNISDVYFSCTEDNGGGLSYKWYVWRINGEFISVKNDDSRLKNSFYGVVYPAKMILFRMKNGYFYGTTPRFE